jgi:hypothetical protein
MTDFTAKGFPGSCSWEQPPCKTTSRSLRPLLTIPALTDLAIWLTSLEFLDYNLLLDQPAAILLSAILSLILSNAAVRFFVCLYILSFSMNLRTRNNFSYSEYTTVGCSRFFRHRDRKCSAATRLHKCATSADRFQLGSRDSKQGYFWNTTPLHHTLVQSAAAFVSQAPMDRSDEFSDKI